MEVDSYAGSILKNLNLQRKQVQFCDCVLRRRESCDRLFPAHKCLLAASSPVLASIVSSAGVLVELQDPCLSHAVLSHLLDYVYTGALPEHFNHEQYNNLLTAAKHLQMNELQFALVAAWQQIEENTCFCTGLKKDQDKSNDMCSVPLSHTQPLETGSLGRKEDTSAAISKRAQMNLEYEQNCLKLSINCCGGEDDDESKVIDDALPKSGEEELKTLENKRNPSPYSLESYPGSAVPVICHSSKVDVGKDNLCPYLPETSSVSPDQLLACRTYSNSNDLYSHHCLSRNSASNHKDALASAKEVVQQNIKHKSKGLDEIPSKHQLLACSETQHVHVTKYITTQVSERDFDARNGSRLHMKVEREVLHKPNQPYRKQTFAAVDSQRPLMMDMDATASEVPQPCSHRAESGDDGGEMADAVADREVQRNDRSLVEESELSGAKELACLDNDQHTEEKREGHTKEPKTQSIPQSQTLERGHVTAFSFPREDEDIDMKLPSICSRRPAPDSSQLSMSCVSTSSLPSMPTEKAACGSSPTNPSFHCSLCDRSFSQRGSLNRHVRSHLGVRPFPCPCCQMTFSRQYRVTEHMRVHQRCGVGNCLKKSS